MRRILLGCTLLALLALPAAASAGASVQAKPGYLVVRKAAGDGGVNGEPVATLIIQGFVLGRVSQEARVDIVQIPTPAGQGAPQVRGADVRTSAIKYRPLGSKQQFAGKRYIGSNFRFRAMGGTYRVVVRGSGVYLFAGGQCQHVKCHVKLQGSSHYPLHDGEYSVDGGRFRSLPEKPLTRQIGRG
jgi:hypothetical protein